jgi:hypothetical protein
MATITITINPALPCFTRRPILGAEDALCGKLATVAQADPLPDGTWQICPMCRECVTAMVRVYGIQMPGEAL